MRLGQPNFADHLVHCGGDTWIHTIQSWLVTVLASFVSKVHTALWVGVDILTYPTMLVQLPTSNGGLRAYVGIITNYHTLHPRLKTYSRRAPADGAAAAAPEEGALAAAGSTAVVKPCTEGFGKT
jgi:hypothetical protein